MIPDVLVLAQRGISQVALGIFNLNFSMGLRGTFSRGIPMYVHFYDNLQEYTLIS